MASLLLISMSALLVSQSVNSAPAAAAGAHPKPALAAALAATSTEAPPQPHPQPPQPLPFSSGVRYDQRQTGNLNVQVDLKDVEIYAIFDDSLFGSLGARWHKIRKSHQKKKHHFPTALTIQRISQDYEYDYSQLTERPTSTAPSSSSSTPSSSSPTSNRTSSTKSSPTAAERGTSARPITIFFTRKTAVEPEKQSSQLSSPGIDLPTTNTSLKIVRNEVAERRFSPTDDNDPQLRSNEPAAAALLSASASAPSSTLTQQTSTSRPVVVSTSLKPSVANRRCGAGFHRDASGRCRRNRRPLRNKNSTTKNGTSKSKSPSLPRTLENVAAKSTNNASPQEPSTSPKPVPDNVQTVQNQTKL